MDPEIAVSFSGGGFSNYFPRPAYQNAAVSTYLQSIDTMYSGLYKCVVYLNNGGIPRCSQSRSHSGRGYPDISAQALNFQIVLGGMDAVVSGTSCSAPVRFAAFTIPRLGSPSDRPQQVSSPS